MLFNTSMLEINTGSILISIIIILFLYKWYQRPLKYPPGPRGIPFIGSIPFLGKYPERTIRDYSKTYGPIMSVRMGWKDIVFLNDFDSIQQALVKQASTFSGRPVLPTMGNKYGIAFMDYGETYKTQRKFGNMTLRGLGLKKTSMESLCLEELNYLSKLVLSKKGKAFDVKIWLHKAISNCICNVTSGKRFEYDDPKFSFAIKNLLAATGDPVGSAFLKLVQLAPILKYIPPFSIYNNKEIRHLNGVVEWFTEIIDEHEKTFDENNIRDFSDAFILEIRKNVDSSFSKTQLAFCLRDLYLAGTETSASTLNWSLLCFLHYPQTQKRIRQEVINEIGSSGFISMSHKAKMPYTNAFMQEIYRFRTILPMSLPHKTKGATQICGHVIPDGAMVAPNLWAVHNDSSLWREPEKFKPERFLDEKGNYTPSNHVISFSVGPRHCLGEQLARMEVFIFLVGLVQKFEFLPDPAADQLPNIEGGSNGLTFVPLPYKLIAKEY